MISSSNENSSSTHVSLLALFLLTRLLVALRNKNKLLAWSTGFYHALPDALLLYWSPTPIQFANFSLLILFYIQVLTGPDWRSKWRNVCLPLYLLLTMTMATFTVVWAFNSSNDISKAARRGDEYDQEFSRVSDVSVQLKYSAFSFFLLSVLFGFFGWKMANNYEEQSRSDGGNLGVIFAIGGKLETKATSNLKATVINSLLCFIFFTRGIRDLVTSQSWFLSIWNNLDMNGRVTTVAYFVFFCFWEFLPTLLLLCLISSKAGGVGVRSEQALIVPMEHEQKDQLDLSKNPNVSARDGHMEVISFKILYAMTRTMDRCRHHATSRIVTIATQVTATTITNEYQVIQ
ncbi:hypothetical protein GQ600_23005 [Phytophthora cactorum]|nr:hypothetical protein GQ600_23005 [Phytophthora cactorum]